MLHALFDRAGRTLFRARHSHLLRRLFGLNKRLLHFVFRLEVLSSRCELFSGARFSEQSRLQSVAAVPRFHLASRSRIHLTGLFKVFDVYQLARIHIIVISMRYPADIVYLYLGADFRI